MHSPLQTLAIEHDQLAFADEDNQLVFADEDNQLAFADEDNQLDTSEPSSFEATQSLGLETWTVIVIDDDPIVHKATELALKDFTFEGKPLTFLSAYSAAEGKHLLAEWHLEAAFVLLDVVMETNNAGLEVVQYIREDLNNQQMRIILRTGNPGDAPAESIILNYDINDYKLKVELTRKKLVTTVVTTLRSYRDIVLLEQQRLQLNQALEHLEQTQSQLQLYNSRLEEKVARRTADLERANQELQRLVMVDGLTQVSNRRHFDEYLGSQWSLHARQGKSLALILVDVDHFKLYNDCYGHQAGDDCLRQIAQALKYVAKRSPDLVARYGGEEFAVVLPMTEIDGAVNIARQITARLQHLAIPHGQSPVKNYVTLSLGITALVPVQRQKEGAMVELADQALYFAKEAGRNCYCIHTDPVKEPQVLRLSA